MIRTAKNRVIPFVAWLASPTLLFYLLPWLMCLLVLGTVAQRYVGLYQSERLFFGSFIVWAGDIPLPGAYSVLGVIAASLLVKLLFYSRWEKSQSGVILTHMSAVILLAGGLMTASFRQEGYMVLPEGEAGSSVSDYYQRELAVTRNGGLIMTVPVESYRQNRVITQPGLPFSLRIAGYCAQCAIAPRRISDLSLRGIAVKLQITSVPETGNAEAQGQSGAMVELSGTHSAQDGTYVTAQALKTQPEIILGADRYGIVLRPAQRALPFSVRLNRFTKTDYPGTDMARAYRSDVAVKDGAVEWNAVIQMNQPLRYKGYTLYQSSFVENGEIPTTVLAVVKNAGQWFPYFSIATLCAGLLLHLMIMLARREGKAVP